MRPYEIMVILDAGLEEDAIRQSVDRATDLITSRGGTVGRVDRWGKRRFAYELHHRWEGYYVVIQASTEPSVVAELDRMLHLADEVIRHKVIHLPDAAVGQGARSAAAAPPAPVGAQADASANGA
jgi:small subunit ribosomal protein S6